MSLLTCEDVCISYQGHVAVEHVSFSLEPGDYLCIVGENGSGKSTLVKGILGLVKPQSGRISFSDMQQKEIGYLPQQTVVQKDFPATVFEVVLSGLLNRRGLRPFYSRKEKEIALMQLRRLNMEDLRRKSYRELSGGQQQRVLLARALCATKRLLLLDEPVTGLDPVITAELYALVKQLNQEQGITVMMVSHDIASAVQYADKILHMGTSCLFFGNTQEYCQTELYRRMKGECGNV